MKRALSLILSLLMLISAFTALSASAQEASDPELAQTGDPSVSLDVPQIRIVTDDNVGLTLKKTDGYVPATVTIIDTDGTETGGAAEVKIRGNSTSGLNKKPYTFKLSKKLDVLGMGKAKKWALLANMFDPTLLRNYVGINTARELGLSYTSEQRVVEVWMDGSFRGCYNLLEPVEEGQTRVDIDIESNDGINDFMIEREYNRVEDDATYLTTNGIRFVCSEPDTPTEEQLAYMQSTMDRIIATLKTGVRSQIESVIDIDSFVKYYVLAEVIKPVDFDYSSVFFYYKGGKLYAGPAWDYDLSMGNEDPDASVKYANGAKTDGVYANQMHLYKWLSGRAWFFDMVRKVYLENQAYFESIGADGGLLDTLSQTYAGPIGRNFTPSRDGGAGWTYKYYTNFNRPTETTYEGNLSFLKNWANERTGWLNSWFTEDIIAYQIGDADGDGSLSIMDATLIQRKLADYQIAAFDEISGDADCDAAITIFDATCIQRYLAEYSTLYTGDQMYRKA